MLALALVGYKDFGYGWRAAHTHQLRKYKLKPYFQIINKNSVKTKYLPVNAMY